MNSLQTDSLLLGAALLCAGVASIFDVRTRRIPNWLTFGSILVALALQATRGWQGLGLALLSGALGGAVLLFFFLAGGLGAGDVKLMMAVTCFTGLHMLPTVLLATALSGALFALVVARQSGNLRQTFVNTVDLLDHHLANGLQPHPEINTLIVPALRVPYALPIFVGCAAAFAQHLSGASA